MSDEVYIMLVDLLTMEKDWTIHKIIRGSTSEKPQRVQLEDLFLYVADHYDDEKAIKYWRYLKHCLHDIELLQFTKNDEHPKTVHSRIVLPSTAETREAKSRAQANCAAKAIELWKKIPRSKVGKLWTDASGREYVNENLPTLLETKEALLIEIANRWRNTKDEEEAKNLFEFLIYIKPEYKEDELVIKVVREATDSHFPVKRLFRCLGRLASSSVADEFKKILAIAWARNMDFRDLANIARATEPLFGASDSAFNLLEHYSYKVAPLNKAVSKLLATMKGEVRIEGLRQVYGDKTVFYLSENGVAITVASMTGYSSSFKESQEESQGHEQFENARGHVLHWKNEYPNYCVCLKLAVVCRYDSKNCVFSREQTFN